MNTVGCQIIKPSLKSSVVIVHGPDGKYHEKDFSIFNDYAEWVVRILNQYGIRAIVEERHSRRGFESDIESGGD